MAFFNCCSLNLNEGMHMALEAWIRTGQRHVSDPFRLDRFPGKLLLGNGPSSAVFSGMTGLDFLAWDEIVDFLLVKHCFWHRCFDGMYGSLAG